MGNPHSSRVDGDSLDKMSLSKLGGCKGHGESKELTLVKTRDIGTGLHLK